MRGGPDAAGNFIGYARATEEMRRALLAAGGVETDGRADVAVHLCFPARFERDPLAERQVLFTMYENPGDDLGLTRVFKPPMDDADLVVTPSRFCAEMFRRYTETPIEVCPLGVDPDLYPYRRRRWRGFGRDRPFVWLYVGAPNRRKLTILPELWAVQRAARGGGVQIYIKNTGLDFLNPQGRGEIQRWDRLETPWGDVFVGDGQVVDNRLVPPAVLLEIYHAAHAFVHLHCGEGWGLTSHEAMATGLPTLISDYSGTQEFADARTAFPVRMVRQRIELKPDERNPGAPLVYDGPWPDLEHAVEQAAEIQADYRRATMIAKAGSARAKALSWRAAGQRLVEILSSFA